MASESGTSIMARARTIASQTMTDANQSAVIDSLGGVRALLNNSIQELYRRKANDIKFRHDITVDNVVAIGTGTGTVPAMVMREFLGQANITDDNTPSSLISYLDYAVDTQETFDQLGYLWITGQDTFNYRAPAPDLDTFTGNVTVSVPSFPTFPAAMSDPISFPSVVTVNDVVLLLANAILGKEAFQLITV